MNATASKPKVKRSLFHAGFEGDLQITTWDRRRDRVYSLLRKHMLTRTGPSRRRIQAEIARVQAEVKGKRMSTHRAKEIIKEIKYQEGKNAPKFVIKTEAFVEKR